MGAVLNADQRRHLDGAVQRARIAAEQAAADALRALAVAEPSRPPYLDDDRNSLRLALREKARQLGDDTGRSGADLTNLTREVAYEQWHRLLFARFLEVNGLLRHPEFRDTSLTLDDCADLAGDLDEPDGWSVAARFAAEILPGVFRLDDPAVQVRFATEHRLALENILTTLPSEVFETEDALGWVYQFWQTAEKKRVSESGVKIGGADLSPVTQLFTENYMVRFLLENSLGAWWTARHPDSALIEGWEYLRRLDDGTPAAGTFDDWPASAAEVTVMDPCCGSGHFLVAMFGMLWRMRAEDEGLSPAEAQDAVLKDNLHGLELDPRCAQIATFNVALEAWKQGGFRDLPAPQVACSGVPIRGTREEWLGYAGGDDELAKVLGRLHPLFRHADTLGSLIDPRPASTRGQLFGQDLSVGVSWDRIRSGLGVAMEKEDRSDSVLGHAADDVSHAAGLLGRAYCLVATNPPYLGRPKQDDVLAQFCIENHDEARNDLAFAVFDRFRTASSTSAFVMPQSWLFKARSRSFREMVLTEMRINSIAWLGEGGFHSSAAAGAFVALSITSGDHSDNNSYFALTAESAARPTEKAQSLRIEAGRHVSQREQLRNPGFVILAGRRQGSRLGEFASSHQGIKTGDNPRFWRCFWEVRAIEKGWVRTLSASSETTPYGGRSGISFWQDGYGRMSEVTQKGATFRGQSAWKKRGVSISEMRNMYATLYDGEIFDGSATIVIPSLPDDLGALWYFCASPEFREAVAQVDKSVGKSTASLESVEFDPLRWRRVAENAESLPSPGATDPTQWLFDGDVRTSTFPLQVGVARLLGYRWPAQKSDELDQFADRDGIASLQSLPGEPNLATRLRELLAAAYGSNWSSTLERALVTDAGGKNGRLEDWLRDSFFAQHVKVFDNRPFLWHVWDGRNDGFAAVVDYHRLDHKTLEKLTFTSLGAWIERQKHEADAGRAGADARLAAAEALHENLKLILNGAPPYDVYVRWKRLAEQPIGWNPDLEDGVRLNIRPFVTAGVLRSRVNVHWKKDRGMNADGSERLNDLHPTLEERREARRQAEVSG